MKQPRIRRHKDSINPIQPLTPNIAEDDYVYDRIEFYYTFKEPMVAVSGISMKSSGTLNDLILSFTD